MHNNAHIYFVIVGKCGEWRKLPTIIIVVLIIYYNHSAC